VVVIQVSISILLKYNINLPHEIDQEGLLVGQIMVANTTNHTSIIKAVICNNKLLNNFFKKFFMVNKC
jgi:hypothetical protein